LLEALLQFRGYRQRIPLIQHLQTKPHIQQGDARKAEKRRGVVQNPPPPLGARRAIDAPRLGRPFCRRCIPPRQRPVSLAPRGRVLLP
jgi:hypothetical protein